jgi:hypothetical protein
MISGVGDDRGLSVALRARKQFFACTAVIPPSSIPLLVHLP